MITNAILNLTDATAMARNQQNLSAAPQDEQLWQTVLTRNASQH